MKLTPIKNIAIAIVGLILLCSIASCVKEKFSSPTATNSDPAGLYATMTISQFKSLYCGGSRGKAQDSIKPVLIKDSIILCGIINADDRSGNIYKTLIFQDSTGGMQIEANRSDLYNTYPYGTRIFVKCKGMYLYNYLGTLEMGSYIDTTGAQPGLGGIPSVNIPTYVVKGMTGLTVKPKIWTISSLNNNADPLNDQSTLIQLNNVEFTSATDTIPYADAIHFAAGNTILSDCASPTPSTVTVRSSGYADFATAHPPSGSGTIVGIFTIYQESNGSTENQITIRDTTDVQLSNARICP